MRRARCFALCLAPLLAAACSDVGANAALRVGPDGVAVYPYLSGRIGGAGITISP